MLYSTIMHYEEQQILNCFCSWLRVEVRFIPWSLQAGAGDWRLLGTCWLLEPGQRRLHCPSGEAGIHPESRSGSGEKHIPTDYIILCSCHYCATETTWSCQFSVLRFKWVGKKHDINEMHCHKSKYRRKTRREEVTVQQGGLPHLCQSIDKYTRELLKQSLCQESQK